MSDWKYGDLVCYRWLTNAEEHDEPIMYVGQCSHQSWSRGAAGLIDIMGLTASTREIEHKSAAMWQKCSHIWETSGAWFTHVEARDE